MRQWWSAHHHHHHHHQPGQCNARPTTSYRRSKENRNKVKGQMSAKSVNLKGAPLTHYHTKLHQFVIARFLVFTRTDRQTNTRTHRQTQLKTIAAIESRAWLACVCPLYAAWCSAVRRELSLTLISSMSASRQCKLLIALLAATICSTV